MPSYTYNCEKCNADFTVIESMAQHKPAAKCEKCGTESRQVFREYKPTFMDKNKDFMAGMDPFQKAAFLERHAAGK